jgi:hypothetical protein
MEQRAIENLEIKCRRKASNAKLWVKIAKDVDLFHQIYRLIAPTSNK